MLRKSQSRGRWEGVLGWGTHVNPWLIHVNVQQNPLQYCKVISLQLIKKNILENSRVIITKSSMIFSIIWHYSRASQVVLVVKDLPASAGDIRGVGSIPGLRRSPGGGHGNLLQYSSLENPLGRGAWWAPVHGVAKIQTQLSDYQSLSHPRSKVLDHR